MAKLFAGLDAVRSIIARDDTYTPPHLGRAVMKDEAWDELNIAVEALREVQHAQDTVEGFDWGATRSRARLQAFVKQLESPWIDPSIAEFEGVHELAFTNRTEALRQAFCRDGGADHQPDAYGRSPLLAACMSGAEESACFLLESGACQQPDHKGRSPLHAAAAFGSASICEMLIVRGAGVNGRDTGGKTPLHSAAERGQRHVCELLIARGAENKEDTSGNTPLMLAANACLPLTCALLLKCGAKVNVVDDEEACSSPLILAASKGSVATCKVLIEAGADVNYCGRFGSGKPRRAALHCACAAGSIPVIKLLLDSGATFTSGSGDGTYISTKCPLQYAVDAPTEADAIDVFKLLISRGHPIQSHGTPGVYSPLWYCTVLDCVRANRAAALDDVVRRFSATGQVTMQGMVGYERGLTNSSQDRSSLLCCAADVGGVGVFAWLVANGFQQGQDNLERAFCRACVSGRVPICELMNCYLLRRPGSPRGSHLDFTAYVESRNMKPIQLAAMHGRADVCTWLVEKGVHPDSAATDTKRPLRLAAENYKPHTCAALLRAGADPGQGWNLCGFRTGGTIQKWMSDWSRTDKAIVLAGLREAPLRVYRRGPNVYYVEHRHGGPVLPACATRDVSHHNTTPAAPQDVSV